LLYANSRYLDTGAIEGGRISLVVGVNFGDNAGRDCDEHL
jgi:hypothetical protein